MFWSHLRERFTRIVEWADDFDQPIPYEVVCRCHYLYEHLEIDGHLAGCEMYGVEA